jgi:nitrite reductase/ring-hydroxylating ferredoxin subunit
MLQRRAFLRRVFIGIGAGIAAVGALATTAWLLGWRFGRSSAFKRVALLGDLEIGKPKKFPIFDVPPAPGAPARLPLGQVWLVRRNQDQVDAYTARCPHHAGSIEFNGKEFICPKHGANFDLACHRITRPEGSKPNPAPRDMDSLEVRQVPDPDANAVIIEVKFQDFAVGHPDKLPT